MRTSKRKIHAYAFLVNKDIESNLALNLLMPEFHTQTVAIFLSQRVGASGTRPPSALGQLAFVEQDLFNDLVFPLAEQNSAVDDRFLSFGELESHFGIPVQTLTTVKDAATLEKLRNVNADIFVSIRFGKILGKEVLALPTHGVLNLHSGLLPQYRGVLATLRALLNGDAEIGCTLHWIDSPGIDVGGIVDTARTLVKTDKSLLWHILALYPLGVELIANALRQLERGESLISVPQDPSAGAYYSFPMEEDLIRFTNQGWRLFDREDVQHLLKSYGCESIPRDGMLHSVTVK